MKRTPEYLAQRLETCRKLFFEYNGREHARIEREMRAGGFPDFNRRCLYARGVSSGWIEKFGWDLELQRRDAEPHSQNRLREHLTDWTAGVPACNAGSSGVARTKRKRQAKNGPLNEFHRWLKKVSPPMFDWDAKHLKLLVKTLQLVTEGKIKRLMIFMPPRHGKSELVTIRYTAWRLLKDPTLKVILASYAQALANRFSRNIRNTLAEHVYQERSATDEHGKTQDLQRGDAETLSKPARSKGDTSDSRDSQDSQDSRLSNLSAHRPSTPPKNGKPAKAEE